MRRGLVARVGEMLRWIWNHPANADHRLRAVARAALFHSRYRLAGKETLAPIGDHSQIWASPQTWSSKAVVYANPPDWPEMLFWREAIAPSELFIDVGANIGAYSIWMADAGARVIAIEPDRQAFQTLLKNIALNGYLVETWNCAVSDRPGIAAFTTDLDTENHIVTGNGRKVKDMCAVEVRTLDDIIGTREVAGLKLDIEGFERLALVGARNALDQRRIRLMQIEWNDLSQEVLGETRGMIAAMLNDCGYEVFRPRLGTSRREICSDVFASAGIGSELGEREGASQKDLTWTT